MTKLYLKYRLKVTNDLFSYNVLGTEVVLEACKANSVPILIYCSSISIYVGHDEVKKGTETTVPIPHKFMFEKYAKTKLKAQNMVLGANGDILKNGKYNYNLTIVKTTNVNKRKLRIMCKRDNNPINVDKMIYFINIT